MITCHRSNLEQRCIERGYSLDEVMPCVTKQDGDEWTIDIDHPSFPRSAKTQVTPAAVAAGGPGDELKTLLAGWPFYITASPDCSCNQVANQMNAWGPDECERPERIDEVVAVMRAEAEARGLPFLDVAGRLLVRRAIANARRNA